jgi:hypothetical protein
MRLDETWHVRTRGSNASGEEDSMHANARLSERSACGCSPHHAEFTVRQQRRAQPRKGQHTHTSHSFHSLSLPRLLPACVVCVFCCPLLPPLPRRTSCDRPPLEDERKATDERREKQRRVK